MDALDDHPLQRLLAPYRTPGLALGGTVRFHDAPPSVARDVLARMDGPFSMMRPNGQPPAAWLVDAAQRWGGTVAGMLATGDGFGDRLRIDAVCVPGLHGHALARAVAADWPDRDHGASALELALAEEWQAWDAATPTWSGPATDLLRGREPAPVVGLWWD